MVFNYELYSLVYHSLIIFACALFLLFIVSMINFIRKHKREDIYSSCVMILLSATMLLVNWTYVVPEHHFNENYDSVKYFAMFGLKSELEDSLEETPTWILLLPYPEEKGLVKDIHFAEGSGSLKVVDSDYGKGLEIRTQSRFIVVIGHYITDKKHVNYMPSMISQNETTWPFYFHSDENNLSIYAYGDFRIIHQDPTSLLSRQTMAWPIYEGWNWMKIEYWPPNSKPDHY